MRRLSQVGKQQRLMFPKDGSCATIVLTLVHFDVCKTMQTISHGGAQYFQTFIDDYSKYSIVVLLKSKTEVL
jgi:hypothetical protein